MIVYEIQNILKSKGNFIQTEDKADLYQGVQKFGFKILDNLIKNGEFPHKITMIFRYSIP